MTETEKLAKALGITEHPRCEWEGDKCVGEVPYWNGPESQVFDTIEQLGKWLNSPKGQRHIRDRVRELWCKGVNDDYSEEGQIYQFIQTWEDLAGIEISFVRHTGLAAGFEEHCAAIFDADTKAEVYAKALLWLWKEVDCPN